MQIGGKIVYNLREKSKLEEESYKCLGARFEWRGRELSYLNVE